MTNKVAVEQQFRCKTQNCSKSFKNASSLFRHNKCCVDFVKPAALEIFGDGWNGRSSGVDIGNTTAANAAVSVKFDADSSGSEGENHMKDVDMQHSLIRDAAFNCDPEVNDLRGFGLESQTESNMNNDNKVFLYGLGDNSSKSKKKQVILNPAGETSMAESFYHEDLFIDEVQAAKLETFSCYAGVPQRDKAGRL